MSRKKRSEVEPTLTVEEVAAILRVTEETVRSYITRKKDPLPAYKLGREYRIPRTLFEKWMRNRLNTPDE
jgi:excisionase family DNA binding protein